MNRIIENDEGRARGNGETYFLSDGTGPILGTQVRCRYGLRGEALALFLCARREAALREEPAMPVKV